MNENEMRKIVYIIIFIGIAFSCKKDSLTEFDYKKFKSMRDKWEQLNIKNYSFTYGIFGFGCVENNYVVKDFLVSEIHPDTSRCYFIDTTEIYTIDDIFQKIEDIYKDPYYGYSNVKTSVYCEKIVIDYDSAYYYPCEFEFKYTKGITDIENHHFVTSFTKW